MPANSKASLLETTLLSMARAGDGVAWLPKTLADADMAEERLVRMGVEFEQAIEIRLFAAAEAAWVAARTEIAGCASKHRLVMSGEILEAARKVQAYQ